MDKTIIISSDLYLLVFFNVKMETSKFTNLRLQIHRHTSRDRRQKARGRQDAVCVVLLSTVVSTMGLEKTRKGRPMGPLLKPRETGGFFGNCS